MRWRSVHCGTSTVIFLIWRGAVSIDRRVWAICIVGNLRPGDVGFRCGSGDTLPRRCRSAYPRPPITRVPPMRSAVSAAVFLALVAFSGGVSAQTTDLLLVRAADVSRNIDESEFALQRKGYSAALTDPRVLAAIRGGTTGTIAICFVEWSGAGEQNVVADWTVIRDEEDAGGVAAALLPAPPPVFRRHPVRPRLHVPFERFAPAQPRPRPHLI